ncbi:glycoside hydrolase family 18 protein [Rhizohabitans arisaemae]|uniref:glycoside hydrolase family 18 protein n=1 Tax=Rhizohabitans arisaemae TaxID=2720610 RepID=UPI0024B22AE2|nr:glycoside hydrolase family 18 protein [Rhizohabitans arisaemae]
MARSLRVALAMLVTASLTTIALPAQAKSLGDDDDYKKVAYFLQWGVYGRNFHVKDIDTSGAAAKLTHVNYAFGNVSEDGKCFVTPTAGQGDPWADYQQRLPANLTVDGVADEWGQPLAGNFNQLKKLKAKHPNLKVLMSLGGWSWSRFFSNAALTPASRTAFVESCIDIWLKGNLPVFSPDPQGGPGSGFGVFDGFDIDWEWPNWTANVGNVIRPEDRENFTALLAEFRKQLNAYGKQVRRKYELTAYLPANPRAITAGIEVNKIFKYLDFGTIQGYDLHGPWSGTTGHGSNLYTDPNDPNPIRFSNDATIQNYIAQGAPRHKLVLGVPSYSQSWTNVNHPGGNGLFQPGTGVASLDYRTVANLPGPRFRNPATGALWLYNGTDFHSYDDPAQMHQKARYIKRNGLGGSMMWSLDQDDANASLTKALARVLD